MNLSLFDKGLIVFILIVLFVIAYPQIRKLYIPKEIQKEEIISKAIQTEEGRKSLAESMTKGVKK